VDPAAVNSVTYSSSNSWDNGL